MKGTIVLVFQPTEEGGAGAKKILDVGALDNVIGIFRLHVKPEIPVGEVSSRSGPLLAASGVFEAIIRGKGGHAALPQLSMDPIIMGATNVIIRLQNLVSREADSLHPQDLLEGLNSQYQDILARNSPWSSGLEINKALRTVLKPILEMFKTVVRWRFS
ncbi:IAA-amino acid hydrolase ILR1-like 4 [Glycine soja]